MEYCRIHRDNDTLIVFIMKHYETDTSGEHVEIRVERKDDMDTYALFTLPAYYCSHAYGFTERELDELGDFLKNNAVTIWDMARGNIRAEGVA